MKEADYYSEMKKDYFNWDAQATINDSMDNELSRLEITKFLKSIEILRNILGENFPEIVQIENHPMSHYFVNKAAWTRVWFTWLADGLLNLKNIKNYKSLIQKLKANDRDKYNEAITLIDACHKLEGYNYEIELESEIVNREGKKKRPDICIKQLQFNENIYLEVTSLKRNPQLEKHSRIFETIRWAGYSQYGQRILSAGKIHKELSDEIIEEINLSIVNKLKQAVEYNTVQELIIPDVIILAIAPMGAQNMFNDWLKNYNLEADTFSTPYFDELRRIKSKIIHKHYQCSIDSPNFLVINLEDIRIDESNYVGIMKGIQETLHKCSELSGLILIGNKFGFEEDKIQVNDLNFFAQRTGRYARTYSTIFMLNSYSKIGITPYSLMRIMKAFL